MNDRIKTLREKSLNAEPVITSERAELLTEFYKTGEAEKVSVPVGRALAFKYILKNKKLCINDGELIVGERGPDPKATPTYPELCTHTLDDFEILHNREKVWFKVDDDVREKQKTVIEPFWRGRSIRDRIFEEVDKEWLDAYEAGIFTEFMEQRAPGHTVLDDKIYKKGMADFKSEIEESIESLDFFNDPSAFEKREQLTAMKIAAEAIIMYAERYSEALNSAAQKENNPERRKELLKMSEICAYVPAHAPP